MRVTLIQRHPVPGWHSIETVFAAVKENLPRDVDLNVHTLPRRSIGIVGRVINMLDVIRLRRRQGIFHVAGDVHYVTLVLPRRRTVLTVHDLGTLRHPKSLRSAVIGLLWFRLPVRWACRTTVVSEATRHSLVKLIPSAADRIEMIPNPLPSGLLRKDSTKVTGRPRILAVGVTPNKNLERLVAAVEPLDVDLLVIGAPPAHLVQMLRPNRGSAGAVMLTEFDLSRAQIAARYVEADALAMVSTSEGFGLPVIEAQSVGLPVVISRIPALEEVAGGAAVAVDPDDVASIRAGIVAVLEDRALRQRLVAAGLLNADRFAARGVAVKYADLYRRVERLSGSD